MCAKKPPFGRRRSEMPRRRRGWGLRTKFSFLWGIQFLCWGCTPLFFFSGCGEKEERRARWRRKRGLLQQTWGDRPSILPCRWLERCAAWCPVVTLNLLLTALRAGAGFGMCTVRSVFFSARRLLKCAKMHCGRVVLLRFFFAVAAQCVGAVRGNVP